MIKKLQRAGIAAALALGAMTVATSAEARDRYYRHHGDATGAAIAGGVIGLALGAAIASADRGRDYYYDGGYYYGRPRVYYYGYPRAYYYRSYPRYYYHHHPRHYYRGNGWRGHYRGW
jgi:hypothetical protein